MKERMTKDDVYEEMNSRLSLPNANGFDSAAIDQTIKGLANRGFSDEQIISRTGVSAARVKRVREWAAGSLAEKFGSLIETEENEEN